jgi:hypothetical protein
MKKRSTSILVIMILAAVLILSSITTSFAGDGPVTMTLYNDVVKKGNYAYCCDEWSLFKVNLKTGKVKRLTSKNVPIGDISVHGKYVYYMTYTTGTVAGVRRVRNDGKYDKELCFENELMGYVIIKSRIYYTYTDDNYNYVMKSMKLNGTNKKTSYYDIKNTSKRSNAKGYKVIKVKSSSFDPYEGKGYETFYLKKPNGKKIKLEKITGKWMYNNWYLF